MHILLKALLKEVEEKSPLKYQFYCDMDGVLVNLDKGFKAVSGGLSPQEYEAEHIENSVSIPLVDLQSGWGVKHLKTLLRDDPRRHVIVVYCTSGARALKAQHLLKTEGIAVSNLRGGINAWNQLP